MRTIEQLARAGRIAYCKQLFEALVVVDPMTGREVPVFEPDPDHPGSYRETKEAQRIKVRAVN